MHNNVWMARDRDNYSNDIEEQPNLQHPNNNVFYGRTTDVPETDLAQTDETASLKLTC